MKPGERVSDDILGILIKFSGYYTNFKEYQTHKALLELKQRREADREAERKANRCPICGLGHNIGNPCHGD